MPLGVTHFSTARHNLMPTFGRWDEDYRLSGADWQLFIPSSCGELAPSRTADAHPPIWRPCLQADTYFIRLAGFSLVRLRNTILACEPGRYSIVWLPGNETSAGFWWSLSKCESAEGVSPTAPLQNHKHAATLKITLVNGSIKIFARGE